MPTGMCLLSFGSATSRGLRVTLLFSDDGKKPDATLRDVEEAIRQLDGVTWTLVHVEESTGRTLTIGGGPLRFVVEAADDPAHRFAVVDPSRGGGRIDLVIGGQLVDYPARVCVTVDVALAAARAFTEQAGARDPGLTWADESLRPLSDKRLELTRR